jgi:hypothetical protein
MSLRPLPPHRRRRDLRLFIHFTPTPLERILSGMSLWRVKHSLSPIVEYALVILVASYGFFAIYFTSLHALMVATLSPIVSLPQAISLDTDTWSRHDDPAHGYAYAVPQGWTVDQSDSSKIRIGRSVKERDLAPEQGDGILVEAVSLTPRQEIKNVAAADFADKRPALYEISVDGRTALFAASLDNGFIRHQAVYIQSGTTTALIARASFIDPAAFATFISTVRFYLTETPKTHP